MKKVILLEKDNTFDWEWRIVWLIKEYKNTWLIWSFRNLFTSYIHKKSICYKVEEL